jgi:hypothetical protein
MLRIQDSNSFLEGRDDVKPLCLYGFLGFARGYNGKDNARQ